jgi:SagB-type dehydrogenase family enzyme
MNPRQILLAGLLIFIVSFSIGSQGGGEVIDLPEARFKGETSLEEVLYNRHSVRRYEDKPITLEQLAQLLWAGKGINIDGVSGPTKTAPSAGGLYPQELFVAAGRVDGLDPGIYTYSSRNHSLEQIKRGDLRRELANAALGQSFIAEAPVSIIIAGVYERSTRKYGRRGADRYVHMDAAHSAQNIFLQAVALELGTVTVGAFNDDKMHEIIGTEQAVPLYIMPVGHPPE